MFWDERDHGHIRPRARRESACRRAVRRGSCQNRPRGRIDCRQSFSAAFLDLVHRKPAASLFHIFAGSRGLDARNPKCLVSRATLRIHRRNLVEASNSCTCGRVRNLERYRGRQSRLVRTAIARRICEGSTIASVPNGDAKFCAGAATHPACAIRFATISSC
jgi:hypothetical protein